MKGFVEEWGQRSNHRNGSEERVASCPILHFKSNSRIKVKEHRSGDLVCLTKSWPRSCLAKFEYFLSINDEARKNDPPSPSYGAAGEIRMTNTTRARQ